MQGPLGTRGSPSAAASVGCSQGASVNILWFLNIMIFTHYGFLNIIELIIRIKQTKDQSKPLWLCFSANVSACERYFLQMAFKSVYICWQTKKGQKTNRQKGWKVKKTTNYKVEIASRLYLQPYLWLLSLKLHFFAGLRFHYHRYVIIVMNLVILIPESTLHHQLLCRPPPRPGRPPPKGQLRTCLGLRLKEHFICHYINSGTLLIYSHWLYWAFMPQYIYRDF